MDEWLTLKFEKNRPRLRAVAYRILGSVSEAEDAVRTARMHEVIRMKNKIAIVLAAVTFALPVMAQTDVGGTEQGSRPSPAWIVALSGIHLMEQKKGGADVVKKLLADPRTIVVSADTLPDPMNDEQRGVSALSSDNCEAALDETINKQLRTLLVDLEHWSGTPKGDQENPESATRKCHEGAQQHEPPVSVIAVPAMDLMQEIEPEFDGTQYQWAIHFDLEGKVATVSDGVEVQLENLEDKPEQFEQTLQTFVHQIREAREKADLSPDFPIYVGLATAVVNKRFSTEDLVNLLKEDVSRTRGLVTGYWMAIPPKKLCPGCGEPNAEVAVELLKSLDE
jgi:hypothetical protein